jgi:soluble lytic murein transglycosylase-like protein
MRRALRRAWRWPPWWVRGALVGLLPLVWLNLTVAWVGQSFVSPLSTSFLKDKARALGAYARHRPRCLLRGHADLAPFVERATAAHKLPPGLLAALIEVESGSRPHRISRAGAMGPAQLMPDTADWLGVKDAFDEAEAVDGAARYLARHLRRFKDVRLALAAYNAGPGAVRGAVPKNGETEFYVQKVMREYERRRPARAQGRAPR